ncbi:MAG: Hsp20/alpha crystallin family protein [Anaerolineae bacterium]|nr:Hsp20/alpha crystallin family protein [Anaerolineae bacterium]
MPKEEKKERRVGMGIDLGLGELFKGLGSVIDLVSGMADLVDWSELDEETLAELRRAGQTRAVTRPRGVYGFSVRTTGGIPRVQPFGNIRPTETGPIIDEVREPLIDVFDENDGVLVIAELPGVEEKDIQTEVKGDTLELSTTTKGRRYAMEIQLPCAVDEGKAESTYKNGVFEIKLPKIGGE